MPFSEAEVVSLLSIKGIGKGVLQRLQEMGSDDVDSLASAEVGSVLAQGAFLSGSSCWQNSPQAKAAVTAAIEWARGQRVGKTD